MPQVRAKRLMAGFQPGIDDGSEFTGFVTPGTVGELILLGVVGHRVRWNLVYIQRFGGDRAVECEDAVLECRYPQDSIEYVEEDEDDMTYELGPDLMFPPEPKGDEPADDFSSQYKTVCDALEGAMKMIERLFPEAVPSGGTEPEGDISTDDGPTLPPGWVRDGDGMLVSPEGHRVYEIRVNFAGPDKFTFCLKDGSMPRPRYFATEQEAIARVLALTEPPTEPVKPAARTFRVPAIGQRVKGWRGDEEVVQDHHVLLKIGTDGASPGILVGPHAVEPVGPDPRFVTIEIRED